MNVDPSMMRLLWSVVGEISGRELIDLSDTALVAMLLQRISRRVLLRGEETDVLYTYIGARLSLIRDLVAFEQSVGLSAGET